jgi:hypothetical protein
MKKGRMMRPFVVSSEQFVVSSEQFVVSSEQWYVMNRFSVEPDDVKIRIE